mgnify:CR=1 FL=1
MIQDLEDSSGDQDRMLYLDCSYGISGDMIVGSLIDLGANPKIIKKVLSRIDEIKIKKITRWGFVLWRRVCSLSYCSLRRTTGGWRMHTGR